MEGSIIMTTMRLRSAAGVSPRRAFLSTLLGGSALAVLGPAPALASCPAGNIDVSEFQSSNTVAGLMIVGGVLLIVLGSGVIVGAGILLAGAGASKLSINGRTLGSTVLAQLEALF